MRRFLPFGLVVVHLFAYPVSAGEPKYEVLQPLEGDSNLILETTRGKARIERQGGASQRLALQANELLTTIAETRGGWTAAGVREEDSTTKIIVFNRSNQGTRRLATPDLQRHPLQLRPTLAVHQAELEGMAWLEGTDLTSLSVRVASRDQGDWHEVRVVAPPARGSQTGLVVAVLDNGDWLLAWSAFDGSDDEILWSIGRQDQWSVPRRLGKGNSAPDIMPALVSTAEGALLTWSRLIDGHYRMMLSRFRANGWSRPQVIGPPGSLEPGFAIRDGQLLLLYRHAWPQGWAVTELAADGRANRLAVVSEGIPSRPVLVKSSGENVELRWGDRRQRVVGWEAVP